MAMGVVSRHSNMWHVVSSIAGDLDHEVALNITEQSDRILTYPLLLVSLENSGLSQETRDSNTK